MRFLAVSAIAAIALAGCNSQYEIIGTNARGTETFKGSAVGFRGGKFDIKSNRGRTCKGSFESVKDLAAGSGKGNYTCSDGNAGSFWFNIEENYKSGNGVAYIGGQKFTFKYGK
jgi:hypothetical protein